jgi:hypothetical protein
MVLLDKANCFQKFFMINLISAMENNRPDLSTDSVPIYLAYWVLPEELLAGCNPGSEDPAQADRKLPGIIAHGIRHIINLMEPGEINRSAN